MVATGVLITAAGIVLVFAVSGTVAGIEVTTLGWILIAVGAVALLVLARLWADRPGVAEPVRHRPAPSRPPVQR